MTAKEQVQRDVKAAWVLLCKLLEQEIAPKKPEHWLLWFLVCGGALRVTASGASDGFGVSFLLDEPDERGMHAFAAVMEFLEESGGLETADYEELLRVVAKRIGQEPRIEEMRVS